jgi:hypothetical protein
VPQPVGGARPGRGEATLLSEGELQGDVVDRRLRPGLAFGPGNVPVVQTEVWQGLKPAKHEQLIKLADVAAHCAVATERRSHQKERPAVERGQCVMLVKNPALKTRRPIRRLVRFGSRIAVS